MCLFLLKEKQLMKTKKISKSIDSVDKFTCQIHKKIGTSYFKNICIDL